MFYSHKNLDVWRKSLDLCEKVYKNVNVLPKNEFALRDQMKRSSLSVPSNISEGAMCGFPKKFISFLSIAQGSCAELETQLMLCQRLRLMDEKISTDLLEKIEEISKMITSLKRSLGKQ